jgi:hypothetical protein
MTKPFKFELSERTDLGAGAATTDEFIDDCRQLFAARIAPADLGGGTSHDMDDASARRVISAALGHVQFCLKAMARSLASNDLATAQAYSHQALKLTEALRQVHDAWPWLDLEAIHESWKQYVSGELMDFETFKHELLKAAK